MKERPSAPRAALLLTIGAVAAFTISMVFCLIRANDVGGSAAVDGREATISIPDRTGGGIGRANEEGTVARQQPQSSNDARIRVETVTPEGGVAKGAWVEGCGQTKWSATGEYEFLLGETSTPCLLAAIQLGEDGEYLRGEPSGYKVGETTRLVVPAPNRSRPIEVSECRAAYLGILRNRERVYATFEDTAAPPINTELIDSIDQGFDKQIEILSVRCPPDELR